ncbi:MAG: ankyrin repeat domain-containing protein [Candidatus Babeliaceae bacterium]|jgi:ankyrin repeat protein
MRKIFFLIVCIQFLYINAQITNHFDRFENNTAKTASHHLITAFKAAQEKKIPEHIIVNFIDKILYDTAIKRKIRLLIALEIFNAEEFKIKKPEVTLKFQHGPIQHSLIRKIVQIPEFNQQKPTLIELALANNYKETIIFLLHYDQYQLEGLFGAITRKSIKDIQDIYLHLDEGMINRKSTGIHPGATPVYHAISERNYGALTFFLTKKADTAIMCDQKEQQFTPLMLAVHNKDSKAVKILLQHNVSINHTNNNGATALMIGAAYAPANIIKMLVKAGAFIDKQDNKGNTAIMYACASKNKETARELLKTGANLRIANNGKLGPLSCAVDRDGDNQEIISLLLQHSAQLTRDDKQYSMLPAIHKKNTVLLKYLLSDGINPNYQVGRLEQTYLMLAAHKGDQKIVEYLLRNGADVTIKDKNGNTALQYAKNHEIKQRLHSLLQDTLEQKTNQKRIRIAV